MCSARILRSLRLAKMPLFREASDAIEEDLAARARLAALSFSVRNLSSFGSLPPPTDLGSGRILNSAAVALRLEFGLQRPGCFALFGHLCRSALSAVAGNFCPRTFGLGL